MLRKLSPLLWSRSRSLATGTVLLVEDEPALRSLAATGLKKLGYTVLEAENGIKALIIPEVQAGKVDIVVADVVMPQMGGPELIEKLAAKGFSFTTILMTGYTEVAVLENLEIGTEVMILQKPFSMETLAAKLEELRQNRRASTAKSAVAGILC